MKFFGPFCAQDLHNFHGTFFRVSNFFHKKTKISCRLLDFMQSLSPYRISREHLQTLETFEKINQYMYVKKSISTRKSQSLTCTRNNGTTEPCHYHDRNFLNPHYFLDFRTNQSVLPVCYLSVVALAMYLICFGFGANLMKNQQF